jgi:hypothetical protein
MEATMRVPPIPTSAIAPVEFIPSAQDTEAYRREKTRQINRAEQALDRHEAALNKEFGEGKIEQGAFDQEDAIIRQRRDELIEERAFMEQTLKTMAEMYPTPQRFIVSVPTSIERDQINSRLVSLGLSQVTPEEIRATMIEELFHQDWSEPGQEPLDEHGQVSKAEEYANFLDSVWMRQEAHDAAIARWQEQEVERLEDEWAGAPAREPTEMPLKIISVRDQAKMKLLIDRMMKQSQRLRDLAASNLDFGRRNAVLLVRMHLIGVSGFEPAKPIVQDPRTRALPEDVVDALREQVDDVAWNELVAFIDRMYRLDGGEEKNSDSPLEKLSAPSGLTEPSGVPASSAGSSTASLSTPAPVEESETITAPLSGSTSALTTEPEPKRQSDSPTDGV